MGNRCTIHFQDEFNHPMEVEVYLHWNGSIESVLAFAEYTAKHVQGEVDDYWIARFVQVIANFMGGTSSIGVITKTKGYGQEDNGPFVIGKREDGTVGILTNGGVPLTDEGIAKVKEHAYWQGEENIMSTIAEANDRFFLRKFH